MSYAHALTGHPAVNSYAALAGAIAVPKFDRDDEDRLLILIVAALLLALAVAGCGSGEYSKLTTCTTHATGLDKRVCAHEFPAPAPHPLQVDPRLSGYVNAFLTDAQSAGRDTPGFGSVETIDVVASFPGDAGTPPTYDIPGGSSSVHVIGLCSVQRYIDGTEIRQVHILDQLLDPASDPTLLEATVYHELGHCFLNLGHTPLGVEAIMSPIAVDTPKLAADWSQLVAEEMAQPVGDPTHN